MKKNVSRILFALTLLLLAFWSAVAVAEGLAGLPAEEAPLEMITWELLKSPAGLVAVIMLLTQGLKYLFDKFTSVHTKYIVYGLALVFQVVLLFVPVNVLSVQAGILAVVNAFVIANAAMGTFDEVFRGDVVARE